MSNGSLYTPYQKDLIPEIPYRQVPEKEDTCISYGLPPFPIDTGYVHAYTNLKAAIKTAKSWDSSSVIVKGYIPRGAYYFSGYYNDICADKMQLTKIVKECWQNDFPYCYYATKLYRRSWWLKLHKFWSSIKWRNYFFKYK